LHRRLVQPVKDALLAGEITEVEAEWIADAIVPWGEDHPLSGWVTRERLQLHLLEHSSCLGQPERLTEVRFLHDVFCETERERQHVIRDLQRLSLMGYERASGSAVATTQLRRSLVRDNLPDRLIEEQISHFIALTLAPYR
jgi:hypothetical protein